MTIWQYEQRNTSKETLRAALEQMVCIYCGTELQVVLNEGPILERSTEKFGKIWVSFCPRCGWWTRGDRWHQCNPMTLEGTVWLSVASGALRNLNLSTELIPLEELRAYLTAKYSTRFQIDPHVFEDAVAAVFKDLGFEARAVGRHRGDGGIDVILEGPNDEMIGVQVKRYRHKVKADYIRSLVGALILNNLTAGVFVTTSDFEPAAREAARLASLRGIPVELINAPDFYDRLKITQRVMYDSIEPFWKFTPVEIDSWDVADFDPDYVPHGLRV